jgi:calcium-dependent protein kinase
MGSCCSIERNARYPVVASTIEVPTFGKSSVRLQHIRESYDFLRVLGYGKFGVVREGVQLSASSRGISVAIKSIPKKKLKGDLSLFMRELQFLHLLDHPNIIKVYETFEDEKYFHLVMELCTGGDLLERILERGFYSEPEAAEIMRKLLLAVNHMHNSYISHRDLKPENILYAKDEIKLGDFGISNKFGDAGEMKMTSVVGTPHYVAPEVLSGRYGKECDVWSLGVIMYVLLSGKMPFDAEDVKEVLEQIMRAEFSFEDSQ